MALICTTSRTWVTQQVTNPVRNWVNRRTRRCRQRRRWWQRLWCWFVTTLVLVIEWVVSNILVPILNTICVFVTWVIGAVLLPFTIAYDAIFGTTVTPWIREWFTNLTRITYVDRERDPNNEEIFVYTFICRCDQQPITVRAANNLDAQRSAIIGCRNRC